MRKNNLKRNNQQFSPKYYINSKFKIVKVQKKRLLFQRAKYNNKYYMNNPKKNNKPIRMLRHKGKYKLQLFLTTMEITRQ